MVKKITERGWSFIDDEGGVDADFFDKTKPIPAWEFLKPIRVVRTITYKVRTDKPRRSAR